MTASKEMAARAVVAEILRLSGVAASYLAMPRKDYIFAVESLALAGIRAATVALEPEVAAAVTLDARVELDKRLAESCRIRR